MRRKLIGVLVLSVMLLFFFASCSLDGILDATEGNVFISENSAKVEEVANIVKNMQATEPVDEGIFSEVDGSGMQEFDLSSVSEYKNVITSISDLIGEDASLMISVSEDIASSIQANGLLKPQSKTEKETFITKYNDMMTYGKSLESFVNYMKESPSKEQQEAAKNTMVVTSSLLNQVNESLTEYEDLPEDIKNSLTTMQTQLENKSRSTSLTQGDVLQIQLITNLVTSVSEAVPVLENLPDDSSVEDIMKNEVVDSLITEVSFIGKVTDNLSSEINLISVPDLSSLINSFINSSDSSN